MIRLYSVILTAAIFHGAFCNTVFADPDLSIVRAVIDGETSHVAASGRTRVDLVAAVIHGLEDCEVSADGVTVGPWLGLPKNQETDKRLTITLCVGGSIEGGDKTAYIGITPKTPFKIVAAIAEKLHACGLTDVRLLSDETVRTQIMPMASPAKSQNLDTASTPDDAKKRITK